MSIQGTTQTASGFHALLPAGAEWEALPDTTTEDYAADQEEVNPEKTRHFLLPLLREVGARSVLDVGCGVGSMVRELRDHGFDAYGVDLPGLDPFWARLDHPRDRFCVVDPIEFRLPFADGCLDFVYTIGAMEHVGTATGEADRRPDYHEIRRRWTREIFRTVRPGGHLLLAGPNRGFPIDVAHAWDSEASRAEIWLSKRLGATVHRTWGEGFLWSYGDVDRYLEGLDYRVRALRVNDLLQFGRVPAVLRSLARLYTRTIPPALLATGLNPWVLALVAKPAHETPAGE